MKTTLGYLSVMLALLASLNLPLVTLHAQGTAFTYQGRLSDGASPATGSYDLRFTLYTAVTNGSTVGSLTNAATGVTNGLFTVALDFGNQFSGADRWLEIAVRTNGGSSFITLATRQLLTPTPYAIYSASAATAASASSVAAANITGTIPLAQLPGTVVTNGASGVNFTGTFSGNGAGVSNVSLGTLNAPGALAWPGNFVLVSSPGVGSQPRSVAAADVNGDGKLDLIAANSDSTLTILTNIGSGGFVAAATNAVGPSPRSVIAADVNGDGKPDLISTTSGPGALVVLTNNGFGGFVGASTNFTGGGAGNVQAVTAADVNGDGKIDLISASANSPGMLTTFTNAGGGAFVLASANAVGNQAFGVTAADVNGDGKIDLISANNSSPGTLSVLTNNGGGVFVSASTNSVGNNPRMVAAADVNGDGKVDLISANASENTITVLTNNGSSGFVAASTNSVGSFPIWIAAVDLNGDGKVDLITANNFTPGTLTALTNSGSGGFALAFTSSVGNSPAMVIAADVNGDSKIDLVSANSATPGTLSILFNVPTFNGAFSGNGAGLSSIPGSAINPGSFVTSLNTLKDAVVLQAGTNVTITPSGNTLTIASPTVSIWNLNDTNAYFNTGNVAIGTSFSTNRLSISGGPIWTANAWVGAVELDNASAIGWKANGSGQRFGFGHTGGGFAMFRTLSAAGNTASSALYDLFITDTGSIGVNTISPTAGVQLEVNGTTKITPGGTGGFLQIGSPNSETGLSVIGNNRFDLRFDGLAVKLVAGFGSGAPLSTSGLAVTTSGKVGVGTSTPAGALHVASGGLAVTGASSPYTGAGSGVFIENGGSSGNLFAFNYSTFTPLNLLLNAPGGNVGIGSATTARLNVEGPSGDYTIPAFRAANTPGLAGQFIGRVTVSESLVVSLAILATSGSVSGNFTKGSGSFKIDHPLDPANKYLFHSFVESPDMMNVYNGNTNLDANGEATVQMPEWFGALNKDFRYQLTSIGAPGPNLYIAEEVTDNHFKIAGGSAGAKVSWQVTGIRQDAWADAHRIKVEEEKPKDERGTYLHPELFGQPPEKDVMKVKH